MKKQSKPIIIHQDLEKIAQLYSAIEGAIPLLQNAWDAFRNTGFFDPNVELSFLIMNHENLKFTHTLKLIREKLPVDSELKLREAEAAKIYEVSTPELDFAISQVKDLVVSSGINYSYFTIKNDKVVINDQALEKATGRHTIAAKTDREIELYKQVNSFINAASKLDKFLKSNRVDKMFLTKLHPIQISRWLVIDDDTYKINPQVFRRISKQFAQLDSLEQEQ